MFIHLATLFKSKLCGLQIGALGFLISIFGAGIAVPSNLLMRAFDSNILHYFFEIFVRGGWVIIVIGFALGAVGLLIGWATVLWIFLGGPELKFLDKKK